MSAAGLPQIAAVKGSNTAGGADVSAMADVSIIVHDQSTVFLAGPSRLRRAVRNLGPTGGRAGVVRM